MATKTHGVQLLVKHAMTSISKPYGEDIILDTAKEIENSMRSEYDLEVAKLGEFVVNQMIGRYVQQEVSGVRIVQVATKESGLIESYTKLRF